MNSDYTVELMASLPNLLSPGIELSDRYHSLYSKIEIENIAKPILNCLTCCGVHGKRNLLHIDLFVENWNKIGKTWDLRKVSILPFLSTLILILLSCPLLLYLVQVFNMLEPVFFVSLAQVLIWLEPFFLCFLDSGFEHVWTIVFYPNLIYW